MEVSVSAIRVVREANEMSEMEKRIRKLEIEMKFLLKMELLNSASLDNARYSVREAFREFRKESVAEGVDFLSDMGSSDGE